MTTRSVRAIIVISLTKLAASKVYIMDFETLARELLNVRTKLLHVPVHQEISRIVRGELFVLNYLNEHNGIAHPKELSENLAVSTARIARLLKHMEEENLIVRFTDINDSRQVIVQLTQLGSMQIDLTRKKVLDHTIRMLERLGPEDAREYIRIQEKICRCCTDIEI